VISTTIYSRSLLPRLEDDQETETGNSETGPVRLTTEVPVNTDGGLKCFGHPLGATGLRMMHEVYKQLQGKADPLTRWISPHC
jgi:acetyl-CoA acetyltransferase